MEECRQPVWKKEFSGRDRPRCIFCTLEAHRAFLVRLLERFQLGSVQRAVWGQDRSPTGEMHTDQIKASSKYVLNSLDLEDKKNCSDDWRSRPLSAVGEKKGNSWVRVQFM